MLSGTLAFNLGIATIVIAAALIGITFHKWMKYWSWPALLIALFMAGGLMWFGGYRQGNSEALGYAAAQNDMEIGATYKRVSQFRTMYGLRATVVIEPSGRLRLYDMEDETPEFFTVAEETRNGIFRKYVTPSK